MFSTPTILVVKQHLKVCNNSVIGQIFLPLGYIKNELAAIAIF
jgi:hypothetical protein